MVLLVNKGKVLPPQYTVTCNLWIFIAATLSIMVINNGNGWPVPGPSSERKEMNVIKILTTYTMFFIKYKYEQKPNTINK